MIPELQYLSGLIQYRLSQSLPAGNTETPLVPHIPDLSEWQLPLKDFITQHNLSAAEATLLLIALTPHLHPDLFDRAIESKLQDPGNFPRIGGVRGKNSRSFLPTGETALFLLAGDDWDTRLSIQQLFDAEHAFAQRKVVWLEELPGGEPAMSGRIIMSQDYIDTFLNGKPAAPHFSMNFPARRVKETRSWDDLVINEELETQIGEIRNWLRYNEDLVERWGMKNRVKKGFRALFHGPPGTGKTLTAGILANEIGKDLYKIDLSMVVSKYIGETEKNLELLFARAEDKGWILFFDEADALFGKRTNVRDAHDKYANQEVSYLLQRIEDFNGLIILATNMRSNIDDAFMRRFNGILRFSVPDARERSLIWRKSFPADIVYRNRADGEEIDLPEQIKKYELSGGSIINAVHYACIKGVERRSQQAVPAAPEHPHYDHKLIITLPDVLQGIRRELNKEGKPFIE